MLSEGIARVADHPRLWLPGQPGYETSQKILQEYGNDASYQPYIPVVTVPAGTTVQDQQQKITAVFDEIQASVPVASSRRWKFLSRATIPPQALTRQPQRAETLKASAQPSRRTRRSGARTTVRSSRSSLPMRRSTARTLRSSTAYATQRLPCQVSWAFRAPGRSSWTTSTLSMATSHSSWGSSPL